MPALLKTLPRISDEELQEIVGPLSTTWDFGDDDEEDDGTGSATPSASTWPGKDGDDEEDFDGTVPSAPMASTWPDGGGGDKEKPYPGQGGDQGNGQGGSDSDDS